ncbi:hypothetical protein [Clostridium akagii]|uniref:hypothetical protein n=1 Tax=Clostridium akagii TaxID=91623 RepID=UPI00047B406D|nr:hypothetical protein [Clostridium akagii]
MSLIKELDKLNIEQRNQVCMSTIYNILGSFDTNKKDEILTKERFEKFVNCNIKHVLEGKVI